MELTTPPPDLPPDLAIDRSDDLSPEARQLSAIASVFGATFSIDDAGEVLGEPVGRLLPWLREIVDAGLVVAEEQAFAFVDDATREAIYARIPDPVRLPLHRQIGSLYLARGGSALPAAGHLASAARLGDRAALAALDRATAEALPTDPQRAVEFALRALDLTPTADANRPVRLVAAVNALVAARRLLDAATLAHATLDRENANGERLPSPEEAELRLTLSSILVMTGRADEALTQAEFVLAETELPERCYASAEVARLLALLAHEDFAAAREPAEAILAGGDGDDALSGALTALSLIAWDECRVADALGLMRAAVQRAERCALEGRRSHPRVGLAPMLTAIGEVEQAATCIDGAARDIETGRDTPWMMTPAILRARLHVAVGALDDAQAVAEATLAAAEEFGAHSFVPIILSTLAQVALLRGDLDAASRYVERFHAQTPSAGALLGSNSHSWVEARVCERQHGRERALEMLLPVFDNVSAHKRLFLEEPASAAWLVRLALACGDRWRASAIVAAVEQLAADNRDFPNIAACAVHARALLEDDVDGLLWASPNQWQPWARASAAEDAATALAALGRHDDSREELDCALAAYAQAGARGDADRVRRRMRTPAARATSSRRRDRPVEGWDSLTDGERRVVALVAEGLTNRQVAGRAFLSRHTVDFHLRQVFRKLNVCSRVELARLTIEHDHAEA